MGRLTLSSEWYIRRYWTTYEKRYEIAFSILVTRGVRICCTRSPGVLKKRAMGNPNLPTVLDILCMVANIDARKLIEIIKAELIIRGKDPST